MANEQKRKVKVKGVSGCPLLWRRWKGRQDWERGVALDQENCAGHYILQLIAAYHAYVAKVYADLEDGTSELHSLSSRSVQEYLLTQQQLAAADGSGGASGATENIRARKAAHNAIHQIGLLSASVAVKNRLVAIDEELLYLENEAAARCREAALLTEKHIRAYLHGASKAAEFPVKAQYQLDPAFDAAADFAARHLDGTAMRRVILAERGDAE